MEITSGRVSVRISILHNKYKIQGGEDIVVNNEYELLQRDNNDVNVTFVTNDSIQSFLSKILAFIQTPFVWSHSKFIKTKVLAKQSRPDVVHIHNYFPLFSPSIFAAFKREKIPTVHTLHNYRSVCPTALLMHQGKIEERSINGLSWWAIKEKVYRNSHAGTFALCCMIELHKNIGTWHKHVDAFIALTEFSKNKFIEAGWPAEKIHVKPNFVKDKFNGNEAVDKNGGYALYVGRLSEEKGINTLLDAWISVDYPLKVVGEGPLLDMVLKADNHNIEYIGKCTNERVMNEIQHADFIILPSTCYEGFPMVLVEAMCCGTPAIVSNIGSMKEIVKNELTGQHFTAGDSQSLAAQVIKVLANKNLLKGMSNASRAEYLQHYTVEHNYQHLTDIYHQAIANANKR